ncbi:MAG: hypothetical protein JXR70_10085 [Spirochaetales bacterium]|nr:hypothetical protein [Spirochaetales bacterium]
MAHPNKILTFLIILFFLMGSQAFSEEEAEDGFGFDFSLGLGVESFSEELNGEMALVTYQKLAISPDFSFGKFGIGLDLIIHYQFQNSELTIRSQDWVPINPNFQNVLELYLSKIKYLRYGHKGEAIYAKFGSIDDATLANGFILGNYSNSMFMPERRILGLSLDLDGKLFDFPLVGIETHVGNLGKFDVLGARLFFRPLVFLDIPVFSQMQIGGSVIADTQPYAYSDLPVPNEALALFLGIDAFQPLIASDITNLAAFADYATYKGKSHGGMLGMAGDLFSILNYGAQIRLAGDGFIPVYFNQGYDLSRDYKYEMIENGNIPGFFGWLASIGTDIPLFNSAIALGFSLDGPFGQVVPAGDVNEYLNYPHLMGYFNIGEGILPGFSFDASYDKVGIQSFQDIVDPTGAIINASINYQTGPAVITFFYQLTFVDGVWQENGTPDVTSGLETSIKLF